ncbi:MAG: hypothetical protein U1F36_20165 [Planctomycetota bacterium]
MTRRLLSAAALLLGAASPLLAQTAPCFETNFGTNLGLSDDSVAYNLPLGFNFPFAGSTTAAIDVASNGSIWVFSNPANFDRCCDGDVFGLLNDNASINPLWMDLDPSSGGAVWFNTFPGRAVITWDQVPEYGGSVGMTFQVQLLQNGTITFWWDANTDDAFHGAIVGVSPGGGAADPGASDLSNAPILQGASQTVYEAFDPFFSQPFDLTARSLEFTPIGTGWLVVPRVGCDPASAIRYGSGCPRPPVVYEDFNYGAFDLSNTSFLFTPVSGGYSVAACTSNCFDTVFGTNLNLTDDSNSGPLNLGFTFNYPGGQTTAIDVASNGFLWLDAAQAFGPRCCDGDVFTFLSDPPSLCPMWMDLDPSSGGAVWFKQAAGRVVVTWDQVPEFGSNNPITAQAQLFADGRMLLAYGTCVNAGHIALAGYSGVSGAVDPGRTDISTSLPFSLSASGTPLSLDAAVGSRPVLGSNFTMVVSNMPSPTPLGIVGLGFTRTSIDLSLIGMSGCTLLQSGETSLPLPATPPSASVSVHVPNVVSLAGLSLYAQGITVSPFQNTAGLLTSNGLKLTLGN